MLQKPPNKYSVDTAIKPYEHIILGDRFNLASVSKSSILTILKANKVSKATGLENFSGRFLKDGAKFLSKPISDLYNLSTTSEKFPDSCKVAKLEVRNSRVTKSIYESELRKMTSHFELLTRKCL